MDNMHWMEPLRANGKQERGTLEVMGFQRKVNDVGRSHMACTRVAPCPPAHACMSSDLDNHITPFSQHAACDGSLSDMLLPFQYDKTLHDLLSEQDEIFVHQLTSGAQNEQSPFNTRTSHIDDGIMLNENLHLADGIIVNHQQLDSAILKYSHDAQSSMLPPLPPLPASPAHTRRPPMRKGTPSYRENHIHSERQRRQDMTSLFNRLRSVLPNTQQDDGKGDRCTILEHVIDYVQELDKKVQALGKVKAELMQGGEREATEEQVESSSGNPLINDYDLAQQAALASAASVSVRFWGQVDIFITLNCPKQRGLWPNLLALLQDTLQLDVQNVALSSTPLFFVHSIYAKAVGDDNEEVCCNLQKTLREFLAAHAYSNNITSFRSF